MLIVKFRSDDSYRWKKFNPILRPGEIAIDTDTGMFKVGDGKTPWNNLAFMGYSDPLNEACIYTKRNEKPIMKFITKEEKEENQNDFGWITEPEDYRI